MFRLPFFFNRRPRRERARKIRSVCSIFPDNENATASCLGAVFLGEIDFRNVNVAVNDVVVRQTDWFSEINFPPKRVSREPFEREFSMIRSRFRKNSIFDVPLSETLVRRDACPGGRSVRLARPPPYSIIFS